MSYRSIGSAPIQKPFLNGNQADRGWLQWFSSVGDALGGKWGISKRNLSYNNINLDDYPLTENYVSYIGREVTFLFCWEAGVQFSNSSIDIIFPTISNPNIQKADLPFFKGMLQVWDGNNLFGGAYAENTVITLPDINSSNRIIIQGTLLTKVTDPKNP